VTFAEGRYRIPLEKKLSHWYLLRAGPPAEARR
jgi:hypothetical protein